MTNVVRQVVSGLGGQFTKSLIGGLANNARSVVNGLGTDNSPGSGIQNKSRFYTNNLSYPMDVETDPMQGHYILFHINETKRNKIKKTQKNRNIAKIKKDANKDFGVKTIDGDETALVSTSKDGRSLRGTVSAPSAISGAPFSLYKDKLPTTRLSTSIALYMPPSVQTSYGLDYGDVEIGAFGEAMKGVFDAMEKAWKGEAGAGKSLTGAGTNALEAVKKTATKALDAVAPGIRAQAQIAEGKIFSDKMELSFKGVNRRTFSFSFVFMPKSEKEAKTIEQIVHLFKFHAHPNYVDGTKGRQMTIPDTFDIQYMYQDSVNNFINKISTCFLKDITVAYGGDRFTAHRPTEGLQGKGAPATRTSLTLTFQEMEILTRERIDQGF